MQEEAVSIVAMQDGLSDSDDNDDGRGTAAAGSAAANDDDGRRTGAAVALDDVTMTYGGPRSTAVLQRVSLSVKSGTRVAVVGRTGAGKSSLLAALLRLRPLLRGTVAIDGVASTAVLHDAWRERVAVLPQDPFVRHGTVRENLALSGADFSSVDDESGNEAGRRGTSNSKRRRRRQAAGQQRAVDQAMRRVLDDVGLGGLSLSAEVGDGGDKLSAGQRQLLGVARVLLTGCSLVVMDEPSAALDAASAARVEAAIAAHLHGCTVIVVTHKLADIATAYDHVVVLHRGRLAEQGTPAALLADPSTSLYRLVNGTSQPAAAESA